MCSSHPAQHMSRLILSAILPIAPLGGRVKIGFQTALMLLRSGAHVVVVTRFPVDAADRYAREHDFAEFSGRLQIHGVDLRHTPSVEIFARYLADSLPRLDYLINNA